MTSEDVNRVEPADASIQDAYNPFVQPQMDDPYPILSRARATEPVFFSRPLRSWVVTRYELVQEVLQNPTVFLSGGLEIEQFDRRPHGLGDRRKKNQPQRLAFGQRDDLQLGGQDGRQRISPKAATTLW